MGMIYGLTWICLTGDPWSLLGFKNELWLTSGDATRERAKMPYLCIIQTGLLDSTY